MVLLLPAAAMVLLAQAQQSPAEDAPWQRMLASKQQVREYLVRRARQVTDDAAREIASAEGWERLRARRLEETRDMLGLLPWPERTPLNARILDRLDKGSYWVENIVLESKPKLYVTGNLYLPKTPDGPKPAVVYVCGHSYSPQGDKVQYQRHGISLAKNGYVAFVLDSIQIAETFALHHGVGWQDMTDWYSRGYSPAGVEVWNAMRAIDYLETRPRDVDMQRIGMTGRSGGAAMTIFTAAVDPRVKVAAPVMGLATYASHVAERTQRRHCDCMFPVNSWAHDMLHLGALIFPRPLLLAHGRKDDLFPVAGYEEVETRLAGLYSSPSRFRNIVVDTGHLDSDFLREQAIRWFDQHLVNLPANRKLDMDYSNAPPEQLAVFRNGGPPADAANFRVHETFVPVAAPRAFSTEDAWRKRAAELKTILQSRVFASLRRAPNPSARATGVKPRAGGYAEMELQTEPGITVRVLIKTPPGNRANLPVLVHVASDGEDEEAIDGLGRGINLRGNAVRVIVYPRGVGAPGWDRTFELETLRAAMQVGETIDSMRLFDVLRTVEYVRTLPQVDPARITLMGKGVAAVLSIYAAALDDRIHQLLLIDPPVSHAQQGPVFLNILRHTDVPEAAALLYPRRINFYARMPKEFEYTRGIYAHGGKASHLFLTMQLEGVVDGRYDHNYSSGN